GAPCSIVAIAAVVEEGMQRGAPCSIVAIAVVVEEGMQRGTPRSTTAIAAITEAAAMGRSSLSERDSLPPSAPRAFQPEPDRRRPVAPSAKGSGNRRQGSCGVRPLPGGGRRDQTTTLTPGEATR